MGLPLQSAHSATSQSTTTFGGGIDLSGLTSWLQAHLPDVEGPFDFQRLDGGQSNPSWVLRGARNAWVVRAKPGPAASLAPSAHAIEREYRVMRALQASGVPVPRVRLLCEDESIVGAAFYVMDFIDGRVFRDGMLGGMAPAERAAIHWEANRVLAGLHSLDWVALELRDFGQQTAFFSRLVRRWTQQYRASADATQAIDAMDHLAEWLPAHIPAGADETAHLRLTHGDYRIENLMFHPTRPQVVAVLDWELSTLGHPLSDLAYHCTAWHVPAGILQGFGDQELHVRGIPSEGAYIRRYCELVGRNAADVVADWPFYLTCNLFRLGAILAGIGARVKNGTAANSKAPEIASMAKPVAELGWAIARGRAPALAS